MWTYGAEGAHDKIGVRPLGDWVSAGKLSKQGIASRGDVVEALDDYLCDVRWVRDGKGLEQGRHTGYGPWPMAIKGPLRTVML